MWEEQSLSLLSAQLCSLPICLISENTHSTVLIRFVIFPMPWPWWQSGWMNRSELWSAHWYLEVRCSVHVSGAFPGTREATGATVAQLALPVFPNSVLLLPCMAWLVNTCQKSVQKIATFSFLVMKNCYIKAVWEHCLNCLAESELAIKLFLPHRAEQLGPAV